MHPYILAVALLSPCKEATPVAQGTEAPCTGIIWTLTETRSALKCKQVDLVVAKADLRFCERSKKAETVALTARAVAAESLLRAAPQPSPTWILPAVTTGAALIGVVAGFFLAGGTL